VPLSAIIGRVMTIYASHVPQPQLGSFGQPLPVDPTLAGETPGDWRWERFGRIVR
jgi:hypothetical protein